MVVKMKVKYIQSLNQKKQRDDDGVFVAEGPKIINDLLSSDLVRLQQLFALKEWCVIATVYRLILIRRRLKK